MGVAPSHDGFHGQEDQPTKPSMRRRMTVGSVPTSDLPREARNKKEKKGRDRTGSIPAVHRLATRKNTTIDGISDIHQLYPTTYDLKQLMRKASGDLSPKKDVRVEVEDNDTPAVHVDRADEDDIANHLKKIDFIRERVDRKVSLGQLINPQEAPRQLYKKRAATVTESMINPNDLPRHRTSPKGLRLFKKRSSPTSSQHTVSDDNTSDKQESPPMGHRKPRSATFSGSGGPSSSSGIEKKPLTPQSSCSSSDDSGIDTSHRITPRLSVDESATSAVQHGGEHGGKKPKEGGKKRKLIGKHLARVRSKSLGYIFGEKPTAPLFGTSYLNREWEIVTVQEMCRRLSLDQIDHIEMPIPEGASSSQILDELMIRQVMEILPARAEGYPWVNIYNSEKHGFSLSTLYRKMAEFDEDMSPVLLIIRDTNEHVFGAIVSSAIRPQEGYAGTGDSCMLWRFTGEVPHTRELRHYTWTGDNQFFVNASKESLSIGAGGGHYGMWLDADLNHGRSQRCDTFDNEPLAGDKEDFIIQFCEAYGFRM